MNYLWQFQPHWITLKAENNKRIIGGFCLRHRKFRKRAICWQLVSYVVYRQSRNFVNRPAVNKKHVNETFDDEGKSTLYFSYYLPPLKWFNAHEIFTDNSLHVALKVKVARLGFSGAQQLKFDWLILCCLGSVGQTASHNY